MFKQRFSRYSEATEKSIKSGNLESHCLYNLGNGFLEIFDTLKLEE